MTFVNGSDAAYPGNDVTEGAHLLALRGRQEILGVHGLLTQLSASCSQLGAMDHLEYFLTQLDNIKKVPHLILVARRALVDPANLKVHDLLGAVLVYEYTFLGVPMRLFNTSDFDGIRAVIAPPTMRAAISAMACRHLMEKGARLALLTCEASRDEPYSEYLQRAAPGPPFEWTCREREVGATILLKPSIDETLAAMGKHTRRNLRYYRRKAEAELNVSFSAEVKDTLTRAQIFELNAASTHPVAEPIIEARLRTLANVDGSFCVGVRRDNGEWISLLGGRRYHGIAAIDWQMNRRGLEKFSVGTVIRTFLIEHEIANGSRQLFFEGGTPHSMKHAFISGQVLDLIAVRRSPVGLLLRQSARWLALRNDFLFQPLLDPALHWTAV